jgi:signal transduction histidine kinase
MRTRESTSPRPRGRLWLVILLSVAAGCSRQGPAPAEPRATTSQPTVHAYEREETRALVGLVDEAARMVAADGEAAFAELERPGSRYRHEETYVFVLDREGRMLVHPDPELEGKDTTELQDVKGRPIVRGLIHAATALPEKPYGWYHYEWPVPGGLLPRWKSSYVRRVTTPTGDELVVGSGMYDDRMERAFVVDMVDAAVGQLERHGKAAFPKFRDRTGPFLAKDAYVFVVEPSGVDLVNPAFPNLEGRNILDVHDTNGKLLVREMLGVVQKQGTGWVDYMWPKPGDNSSTQKSAYVRRANVDGSWVLVGCGVYLADAPRAERVKATMTAEELTELVRDAADVLEERGDDAYEELRERGSKWFPGDTYLFVWNMDGTRTMHAADHELEGDDGSVAEDVLGRPYGKMFLAAAEGSSGEGWVHYMYPEPGDIFPTWKSTFIKRVTFPSGEKHLVGAGIYQMKMDPAFVRDVVDRAAALVATEGPEAFDALRDETGPFFFMDTYVFVMTPDGTELVNPAQPSLEGQNLIDVKDAYGKEVARENIETAMGAGSGWVEYHWYKPGDNTPVPKRTYVRKVEHGPYTYVVGSGLYLDD